jgi:hypothetical protein
MIGWATVDDGSEEDELGSILLLSTSIVKEESAFFSLLIPGTPCKLITLFIYNQY